MTEEQMFSIIGRLYAMNVMKDNELKRLNGLVNEYERKALTVVDDEVDDETPTKETE